MNVQNMAAANFDQHIKQNSYPGRGLVIGLTDQGAWIQIYWIMGRSPNSRSRRFVAGEGVLRTEPLDSSKVENPELIIYEAMLELPGVYLVGNGDQVRSVADTLSAGGMFDQALCIREREPDAPNYTPRITAMLRLLDHKCPITLSILKANAADPTFTDRFTFRPALPPDGFGYCLTTYTGDGSPLPSFNGDPLLLPCQGSAEEILETYWQALDHDNKVALAVKIIAGTQSTIQIRNR